MLPTHSGRWTYLCSDGFVAFADILAEPEYLVNYSIAVSQERVFFESDVKALPHCCTAVDVLSFKFSSSCVSALP